MSQPLPPADFRSVLASVDKDGRRRWVEARIVWGRWRRWRLALAVPLIAFYCAVPFLTIAGRPALQLDLVARRFHVAGLVFWPQDLSYFVLLALIGLVATLLSVALLGRVFCGWLCPHNVFLEMVFRPIEQAVRGTPGSPRRRTLWAAAATWLAFVLVSGGLANAGTAIFVGADAFRWGHLLLDVTAHPYAAVFWAGLFGAILFNFAWFREQTCTIVCPYGRFQTAMLDPHTLVVAYDRARGEPRGHVRKEPEAPAAAAPRWGPADDGGRRHPGPATPGPALGDCIDCGLCVRVCPTAIDIRNGNQLECLHCAACVDACDGIMARLGRRPGLVRYAAEVQLAGGRRAVLRPRTVLYAVVLAALAGLLAWRLAARTDVLMAPLRQTAIPVRERDPEGRDCVRAVLPLSLVNRTADALDAHLVCDPALAARVVLPQPEIVLPPDTRTTAMPIIYIPRDRFRDRHLDAAIELRGRDGRLLGATVVGIRTP